MLENILSIMGEIAAEREEALNDAHVLYLEAFQTVMDYMDAHPPAHRKLHETKELSRLNSICGHLKYQYEIAQSQRYKVVI